MINTKSEIYLEIIQYQKPMSLGKKHKKKMKYCEQKDDKNSTS